MTTDPTDDPIDALGPDPTDGDRSYEWWLDQAREPAADELAEAGHLDVETARDMLLHPGGRARSLLALASEVVVTALDVRGRQRDAARAEARTWQSSAREWESYAKRRDAELEYQRRMRDGWEDDAKQLRAELERLRAIAGGGRCVECGQVESIDADGRLAPHHDTGTDELCDGSGERDHEPPHLTVRVLDNDDRTELERLRARDEPIEAVLEEYAMRGLHRPEVLSGLLDALARAHEDEDGGTAR